MGYEKEQSSFIGPEPACENFKSIVTSSGKDWARNARSRQWRNFVG